MIAGEAALPGGRADRLRDDRHPQRRPRRPGRGRRERRHRRALREAADDHAGRGTSAARDGHRADRPRSSSPTPTPASRWSCSPASWCATAAIGEVRKVEAWYPQGWLATKLEADGQKQAAWRVDPSKAGASGCGGDIGTHAYEFVRFVAGLKATRHPGPPQGLRPRPRARRRLHRPGRAGQRRHRHHRRLADHHRRPERQRLPDQRHQRARSNGRSPTTPS